MERIETKEYRIGVPGGSVWAAKHWTHATRHKTPLLLLHGGPGVPHDYFLPLTQLAKHRPIIFYDQLGCGRSDQPSDVALWTLGRFVEELQCVRDQMGVDVVQLFGHSWGGALATEYALTAPEGLQCLILASPLLSSSVWMEDANQLRAALPEATQAVLAEHERLGTTESAAYEAATQVFYQRHLCRLDPWPACFRRAFDAIALPVYQTMWGEAEFYMTGNLKHFDRIADLGKIRCPVLLTCGRYDEATPKTMEKCLKKLQQGRLEIFEQSAHMAMLEEEDPYREVIAAFCKAFEG